MDNKSTSHSVLSIAELVWLSQYTGLQSTQKISKDKQEKITNHIEETREEKPKDDSKRSNQLDKNTSNDRSLAWRVLR